MEKIDKKHEDEINKEKRRYKKKINQLNCKNNNNCYDFKEFYFDTNYHEKEIYRNKKNYDEEKRKRDEEFKKKREERRRKNKLEMEKKEKQINEDNKNWEEKNEIKKKHGKKILKKIIVNS